MTPVLVVEVLSLSESSSDRAQKKQDWFGDGLKQYWEVDLRNFSVRIEQPDGTSQTFLESRAEIIRNPPGLEGLTIDLKRLFRMVKKLQ
jgi:Uma2 family endonuclease